MSAFDDAVAAHQAGDLEAARRGYEGALAVDPNHAEAVRLWGTVALQQGRLDDAHQALQHALALDDRSAEGWEHLGLLQRMLGAPEAVDSLRRAVALEPTRGSAWSNLALVLVEHGGLDEALEAAERAVAHAPELADAHTNLGLARKEMGDLVGAASAYRHAVALDPLAVAALHGLAETGQVGPDDPAIAHLRTLLARTPLSPADRAVAGFALGQMLDANAAHEEAFRAFTEANAQQARLLPPFDPDALETVTTRLERLATTSLQGVGGHGTALPVFVVGLPRSGTTLVERLLAAHPQVMAAGEVPTLPLLAQPWEQDEDFPRVLPPDDWLASAAVAYLGSLPRHGTATHLVDKQTDNAAHLWLAARMFPNARVVHVVRDPRDVAVSAFVHDFAHPRPGATSWEGLIALQRAHDRVMARYRQVLPQGLHTVAYEDLVTTPEPVLRELLAFLGLPWHDACLGTGDAGPYQRTLDATQRAPGVRPDRVGRWRRFRPWLGTLLEAFGDDTPSS